MERISSLLGLLVFLGIAYALSTDRRAIRLKTVLWGLGLQFGLAVFVLKTGVGQALFSWLGAKINRILSFSYVGSEFVSRSCRSSSSWRPPSRSSITSG